VTGGVLAGILALVGYRPVAAGPAGGIRWAAGALGGMVAWWTALRGTGEWSA